MISIPRSPVIKLVILCLITLSVITLTARHRDSFDKDYWTFKQERDDYKARQQHQQELNEREKNRPKLPLEGSQEQAPLGTFEVSETEPWFFERIPISLYFAMMSTLPVSC